MLQGFVQADFIVRTPAQLKSWSDTITTLIALTEMAQEPTEESLISRLRKFQT